MTDTNGLAPRRQALEGELLERFHKSDPQVAKKGELERDLLLERGELILRGQQVLTGLAKNASTMHRDVDEHLERNSEGLTSDRRERMDAFNTMIEAEHDEEQLKLYREAAAVIRHTTTTANIRPRERTRFWDHL